MTTITRAQAIAQNLPRYFTGKPCAKGHIGEFFVSTGCVVCTRERSTAFRIRHRERLRLISKNWKRANPEKRKAESRDRRRRHRATEVGRLHYNALALKSSRKKKNLPTPTRAMPSLCECCGQPPRGNSKHVLHLDHDHGTGVFRGWLCGRCNVAIGILGDSSAGLMCALEYLKRAGS